MHFAKFKSVLTAEITLGHDFSIDIPMNYNLCKEHKKISDFDHEKHVPQSHTTDQTTAP